MKLVRDFIKPVLISIPGGTNGSSWKTFVHWLEGGRDLFGDTIHQLESELLLHQADCVHPVIRSQELEPMIADHQQGAAATMAAEISNQAGCLEKRVWVSITS